MNRKVLAGIASFALGFGGMAAIAETANATPWPSAVDAARPPLPGTPTRGKMAPKGLPPRGDAVSTQTTCGAGADFYSYAAAEDILSSTDQADGASLNSSIHQCYLSSGVQGDVHCLFELAVRDFSGDQTIEVGYHSDVQVNPNGTVRVWVGSWTNAAFNGYNGGGGWTDAPGCNPCAGDSIAADIGTTKAFKIEHNTGSSRWDVSYNGNVIGYYPDSTWSGGFTKTRFIQAFGETATKYVESCTDMGNGVLAASGAGAEVNSFALINSTASPSLASSVVTNSAAWNVSMTSGTAFRWGGPGYNSALGANGTAGSTGRCAPATGMAPGTGLVCASTFCANAEICPDGGSTGCNTSTSWAAGALPWNCITINGGAGVEFNQGHNSSTTGKEWLVFRTAGCTGSSMLMDSNGTGTWNVVMPAGWGGTAVHAYKRVA